MDPMLAWLAGATASNASELISRSLATFNEKRKVDAETRQRKRQEWQIASAQGRVDTAAKAGFDAADKQFEAQLKTFSDYDDALIVLAILGGRIVALDVVNLSAIEAASHSVKQAFGMVPNSRYSERFDQMSPGGQISPLQVGVIVGIVFCAECYPMHIWRGFGAGVRNNFEWATPYWEKNRPWDLLDDSIASLKSLPKHSFLLKKMPAGMERLKPLDRDDKHYAVWGVGGKDHKVLAAAKKDFNKRVDKKGFPQPRNRSYVIHAWSIPFATWDSNFVVTNERHDWENVLKYQMDPGRLLYAFTIGGHLNLAQGEVTVILAGPAKCLVRWLEGLNGMTFKLVSDAELDFTSIGLSSSTNKSIKVLGEQDAYAILDEEAMKRWQAELAIASSRAAATPVTNAPPMPRMYTATPPSPAPSSPLSATGTPSPVTHPSPLPTYATASPNANWTPLRPSMSVSRKVPNGGDFTPPGPNYILLSK